ncbi:hypothetical protein [Lysobacter claricitrinus]|uniref:hypothetical protein n=1 Tax=Lysobacter claricitrinus TaxID=3367728 RepID=UPI0037DBAF9C
MGLISLLWGIGMLLWMLLALIPLLGAMNWLVIPFAAFGAILAALGMALSRDGHRGRAKAGLLINVAVMIVAVIRLHLGGGLL